MCKMKEFQCKQASVPHEIKPRHVKHMFLTKITAGMEWDAGHFNRKTGAVNIYTDGSCRLLAVPHTYMYEVPLNAFGLGNVILKNCVPQFLS